MVPQTSRRRDERIGKIKEVLNLNAYVEWAAQQRHAADSRLSDSLMIVELALAADAGRYAYESIT